MCVIIHHDASNVKDRTGSCAPLSSHMNSLLMEPHLQEAMIAIRKVGLLELGVPYMFDFGC